MYGSARPSSAFFSSMRVTGQVYLIASRSIR
jgi:hypothetical protein